MVETRPQSGHYVRRRAVSLPEPAPIRPPVGATTVSVSSLVAKVYAAARDPGIVPLGAACPSPEILPTAKLNRLIASMARYVGEKGVDYDLPPGSPQLRQQIARRAVEWGCALGPEDLITTCGTAEAIHLALQAVARRGDAVAIESPAYYGTLRVIEALGLRAVEIPADPREGIDLDALEVALTRQKLAAVIVVSNFSNPLGSCIPGDRKERLVELLANREVPLIEDDVYGDLHFGSERPSVAKAFDRKGLVLLCGSFSKTLAPGFRVGYIAPGRFAKKVELLKFSQTVATATLPQLAIAEFLRSGGYDRHLRTLRRRIADTVERTSAAIAGYFPEGTCATRPAGGNVIWVQVPELIDVLALHQRALEVGISIAPGPIFSARQAFTHHLRINCAHPWSPRIDAALATLGRLARSLQR